MNIDEGQNDSLHCVTDNSDCCNNGQGNWYDVTGGEVQQGPDGDSNLYVTRGDGVVYLNCRRGGQSGMWRCDIPDSNGVQQSICIYLGTSVTGIKCTSVWLLNLDSFQSRGGPVTEVEWMRNGVRVEEDSNHMTSQIIVNTSANTVYNNTLRVRVGHTNVLLAIADLNTLHKMTLRMDFLS